MPGYPYTLACGENDDKLYMYSGFTVTLLSSVDVSAREANLSGICWNNTDTMYCGFADDKIYKNSSFSSTHIDSTDVSGIDGEPHGMSEDGTHTVFCGNANNFVFKVSGFTATVVESFDHSGFDAWATSACWTKAFCLVSGNTNDYMFKTSTFTSTVIDSFDSSGVDTAVLGVTWDGWNMYLAGDQNDLLYKMSAFTVTVTASVDIGAREQGPSGIDWMMAHERRGDWCAPDIIAPHVFIGEEIFIPDETKLYGAKLVDMARRYFSFRGRYRVAGTPVHRFKYDTSPITEDTADDETNATLDGYESTATFTGTDEFYIGVTKYNGFLDSGLGAVGSNSELYRTLRLVSDAVKPLLPYGPTGWRLEDRGGGIVAVRAVFNQPVVEVTDGSSDERPGQWVIAYTTDGSTPATDTPDEYPDLKGTMAVYLDHEIDFSGQSHGDTIKIRLQTRRNDGTSGSPVWAYSANSSVLTLILDKTGPDAPPGGDTWAGSIPEGQ